MSERGDQVQKLLAVLARHADLVAEAFDGSVSGGDRQREAAIEALFSVGALKPYDEDSYRLNPRLREFFSDHLSSYNAFQALRRVSGTMDQAYRQWQELRFLKSNGSVKDQDRLYSSLDESIVEIQYSIEHNLRMLHSLLATQYGNVDDLGSKLRQNRYYARQVVQFLGDVEGIAAFVERTAEQATAAGLHEVRHLVTRRLGARRLSWTSQIKDAQAVISKRLFEAKLMEDRLKRLARFSLWLTRHRTVDGWEIPIDSSIPAHLVRPDGIFLKPQPDVLDTDVGVSEALATAVSKMPPPKPVAVKSKDETPQLLIEDDDVAVVEPMDPVRSSVRELADYALRSEAPISLLTWKRNHEVLNGLSDEAWLMFSAMQLKGSGLDLRFFDLSSDDQFAVNDRFYDIAVSRKAPSPI